MTKAGIHDTWLRDGMSRKAFDAMFRARTSLDAEWCSRLALPPHSRFTNSLTREVATQLTSLHNLPSVSLIS